MNKTAKRFIEWRESQMEKKRPIQAKERSYSVVIEIAPRKGSTKGVNRNYVAGIGFAANEAIKAAHDEFMRYHKIAKVMIITIREE